MADDGCAARAGPQAAADVAEGFVFDFAKGCPEQSCLSAVPVADFVGDYSEGRSTVISGRPGSALRYLLITSFRRAHGVYVDPRQWVTSVSCRALPVTCVRPYCLRTWPSVARMGYLVSLMESPKRSSQCRSLVRQ